jgi:transcriptional regulator with XRE-family HTH domain
VEPITVSRWERGTTPDFDALALIAEATGKPLGYFLGDDEQAAQEPRVSEAAAAGGGNRAHRERRRAHR